jgi:hypothetical protein
MDNSPSRCRSIVCSTANEDHSWGEGASQQTSYVGGLPKIPQVANICRDYRSQRVRYDDQTTSGSQRFDPAHPRSGRLHTSEQVTVLLQVQVWPALPSLLWGMSSSEPWIEPSAIRSLGSSQISNQIHTAWFSTGIVPCPLISTSASLDEETRPARIVPTATRPKYGGTATGA